MQLLPGVTAHDTDTARLRVHHLESGPADGVPVVLVHGNLSTGRFFEHLMPGAPPRLRLIAPDMRGYGRSEPLPIDATRGLADWADDLAALLDALRIDRPVHLLGWSAAALAVAQFAMLHGPAHPVASLTLLCPVSPYGYGGSRRDGTPCTPDAAGSGAGGVNPELVQRLRDGDRSADSPFSFRSVMNALYWDPGFRLPGDREDLLVDEVLLTAIGEGTYPGDAAPSPHWPGFAPGTSGILNALSPAFASWAGIVDLDPKPPVLWTQGERDLIISDHAALEMGALGQDGVIPGWPGEDAYPAQPMVAQTRDVLRAYADAGGSVRTETFPQSGHGPLFDAEQRWSEVFFDFVTGVET